MLVVDGEFHSEGSGHIPMGTNNDAEMAAAIKGMIAAQSLIGRERYAALDRAAASIAGSFIPEQFSVKLCSDSQLCLGWASGRYRHGNPDRSKTVAYLQGLFKELRAEPVWVKGHNGHKWNTRADALAYKGRTGEFKLKRDRKNAQSNNKD